MSHIDIRRTHALPLKDAKLKVERIAQHIAKRFQVDYGWKGNTLEFTRSGVEGHIAVNAKEVHVSVRLGFLLFAIKSAIEREIDKTIDEEFS